MSIGQVGTVVDDFSAFSALICQVVAIDIAPESIAEGTSLADDLMMDSITTVSLLALCQEHFGVNLDGHAHQVANMRTVGDAFILIRSLTATAG
jgi:acyl carrier protein